jgi:hypothetical protein
MGIAGICAGGIRSGAITLAAAEAEESSCDFWSRSDLRLAAFAVPLAEVGETGNCEANDFWLQLPGPASGRTFEAGAPSFTFSFVHPLVCSLPAAPPELFFSSADGVVAAASFDGCCWPAVPASTSKKLAPAGLLSAAGVAVELTFIDRCNAIRTLIFLHVVLHGLPFRTREMGFGYHLRAKDL